MQCPEGVCLRQPPFHTADDVSFFDLLINSRSKKIPLPVSIHSETNNT